MSTGGTSYTFTETFDGDASGSGYDHAGWSENAANPNQDWGTSYTSSPHSLYKSATAYTRTEIECTATLQDSVWIKFRYRLITAPSPGNSYIYRFGDVSGYAARICVNNNRYLQIINNDGTGTVTSTTTQLALNTWYFIWIDYTKGTGANGVCKIYLNTGDSKPGTVEVEKLDGNWTLQANWACFAWDDTCEAAVDDFIFNLSSI